MTDRRECKPASGPVVAIIGGGFSGASVAWHLHQMMPDGQRVVIVEPHADIGRGLAYSSQDPSHRINIPAKRMNIGAGQDAHFHNWLVANNYAAADPAAKIDAERLYPTRQAFGSYVKHQIETLGDSIVHVQSSATALERDGKGWHVRCANGETIEADIAVLAVCHTPPDTPFSLKALQSHPRFFADPWQADPLLSIAPDDSVLIVGTGLTMADTVATLDRLGHRGDILAVSRHGLRSRPHARDAVDDYGDFLQPPSQTTRELVKRVRATIRDAAKHGKPWQAVIDQVFHQGQGIWRALPLAERARLLRHLRTFWDVHRFRIAPQVHDVLERRIAQGTLAIRASSVRAQAQQDEKISVEFRARHSRNWTTQAFDAVILATGPAHGTVFDHDPLLSQIRKAGLAGPDPLKLGIAVDGKGRAISADNSANPLYVAGPLARGTFGELMGISDLARYANVIASEVAHQIELMTAKSRQ